MEAVSLTGTKMSYNRDKNGTVSGTNLDFD